MSYDTGLPENFIMNLEHIQEEVDPQGSNLDWPIVLEGEEGAGKDSLAQAIALEIEGERFSPEDQIAFTGDEFKEKARELEEGRVLIYSEGVDDLMATDTMTSEGRSIVKFLRKCRELNLIIIICFPVFVEMNKKIRKNRIKNLGRCMIKRSQGGKFRYALFYNKSQIRSSDLASDKDADEISYPEPVLSVNWRDPREAWPEVWQKYKEIKEGDIRDPEEDEEDIDLGQVVRIVKQKKEKYMDKNRSGDPYISKELVEMDFDIGGRKGRKVKKAVERDLGWRRIDRE